VAVWPSASGVCPHPMSVDTSGVAMMPAPAKLETLRKVRLSMGCDVRVEIDAQRP